MTEAKKMHISNTARLLESASTGFHETAFNLNGAPSILQINAVNSGVNLYCEGPDLRTLTGSTPNMAVNIKRGRLDYEVVTYSI